MSGILKNLDCPPRVGFVFVQWSCWPDLKLVLGAFASLWASHTVPQSYRLGHLVDHGLAGIKILGLGAVSFCVDVIHVVLESELIVYCSSKVFEMRDLLHPLVLHVDWRGRLRGLRYLPWRQQQFLSSILEKTFASQVRANSISQLLSKSPMVSSQQMTPHHTHPASLCTANSWKKNCAI